MGSDPVSVAHRTASPQPDQAGSSRNRGLVAMGTDRGRNTLTSQGTAMWALAGQVPGSVQSLNMIRAVSTRYKRRHKKRNISYI